MLTCGQVWPTCFPPPIILIKNPRGGDDGNPRGWWWLDKISRFLQNAKSPSIRGAGKGARVKGVRAQNSRGSFYISCRTWANGLFGWGVVVVVMKMDGRTEGRRGRGGEGGGGKMKTVWSIRGGKEHFFRFHGKMPPPPPDTFFQNSLVEIGNKIVVTCCLGYGITTRQDPASAFSLLALSGDR